VKTLLKTGTLILLLANSTAIAQGTFQNLDFEAANLPPIPSGQYGGFVAISDAFPGWTGYIGTNQVTQVLQNNLTLGAPSIDILGPNWSYTQIISGQYAALLQAGTYADRPPADAALAQVGQIPTTARSLQLKESGAPVFVSLAGQPIALVQIGSGVNYVLYAGDISQFAGQTVELRLTTHGTPDYPFQMVNLDDIEFSPVPIPEPNPLSLFALGSLFLIQFSLRCHNKNHEPQGR